MMLPGKNITNAFNVGTVEKTFVIAGEIAFHTKSIDQFFAFFIDVITYQSFLNKTNILAYLSFF